MDGGFYLAELEGLFSKITHEGVPTYVSRWITDGWLGLDLGGERRSWPGTVAPVAAQPWPVARTHQSTRFRG